MVFHLYMDAQLSQSDDDTPGFRSSSIPKRPQTAPPSIGSGSRGNSNSNNKKSNGNGTNGNGDQHNRRRQHTGQSDDNGEEFQFDITATVERVASLNDIAREKLRQVRREVLISAGRLGEGESCCYRDSYNGLS
jgi:hypothetical protein